LVGLGLVEIAAGCLPAARQYLNEATEMACLSECHDSLEKGLAALAQIE
jgi:hypothetical protein